MNNNKMSGSVIELSSEFTIKPNCVHSIHTYASNDAAAKAPPQPFDKYSDQVLSRFQCAPRST